MMKKAFILTMVASAVLAAVVVATPVLRESVQLRWNLFNAPPAKVAQAYSPRFLDELIGGLLNVLMGAFSGSTQSQVGAKEKVLIASGEIEQAEISWDSTLAVIKANENANGTFTPSNLDRACRIMKEEERVQDADLTAFMELKMLNLESAKKFNSADPPIKVALQIIAERNEKYCSQTSVARGVECELSIEPDADIDAASVFGGGESESFSPSQKEAAKAFTANVTRAVPPELMPIEMENTAAGQRYLLERKQYEAHMSLSRQTFEKMVAVRTIE